MLALALLFELLNNAPADLLKPPRENTKVIRPGVGQATPKLGDFVRLRFVEWELDGHIMDSVNGPTAWTIVDTKDMYDEWRGDVLKMHVGEERRTWVPAKNVVIETELLQIIPRPETPADVAAIPKDATVTSSGLAYKILHDSGGKVHPKPTDHVLVHYNAWTETGILLDSTIVRGTSIELPVSGGIPGWSEAIQLMTPGSKMRFWFPPQLAYKGIKDKPQCMMVFDIELFLSNSDIMPKRGTKPGRGGGGAGNSGMPPLPPLPPGVQ